MGKKETKTTSFGWLGVRTACLWSLALFAIINCLLWLSANGDKGTSKDLWSGSGSIDLALSDLSALKERPNIVLLGSSLVMYPFWSMDKESNPFIGDIFHHHLSHTLESALGRAGWKDPHVFNLAIFGQMVSDAYIYVSEFLQGNKRPDWLVLGIAPRDFSDYDLPAPMATMTFKRIVGLSNLGRYAILYLPRWQEMADFIASHTCFFYAKRWRLQHEVDGAIQKVYLKAMLTPTKPVCTKTEDQAGFMLSGSEKERWDNSLMEYRRRYRNIAQRDLSIQMGFLDRLLQTCRQRGIKVVVISMPLTELNRSLLPLGFYDSFRKRIGEIANKPGVKFLDLGDSKDFLHEDFWDSTHLNHGGGHKLLRHLLPVLSPSS